MLLLDIGIFEQAIRAIMAVICDLIYTLIAFLYQLFMVISRLNILSSDSIAPIYQRITMILTIVMTFYITFEFVKYAIQPDTFTDKEKGFGNILQRIVMVVVLIAFVPTIFSLAYKLQNRIIESQVITKVILGRSGGNYNTYGNEFSAVMLSQFYGVADICKSSNQEDCKDARKAVENNMSNLRSKGTVEIASTINLVGKETKSGIIFSRFDPAIYFQFNGLLAVIVGCLIGYMLVMYSIDLGTRYAQLIFLQIMSPIAIMGYMLPKKDGIFQKWLKQCITTYIDLFIRIAIIDFVIMLIKILGDAFTSGNIFKGISGVTPLLKTFTYIALVLGLLAFAKRAPKLLSELLPSSGSAGIGFGLGAKSRLEGIKPIKSAYSTGRRVAGGAGGFLAGGIRGRSLRAAIAGAKEGFDKKHKGLLGGSPFSRWKSAAYAGEAVRQKREDIKNEGGTVFGAEHRAGHYKNIAQEQDRRKGNLEAYSKTLSEADAAVKEMKFMKQLEGAKQIAQANNNAEAAALIENEYAVIKKYARKFASAKDHSADQTDAANEINARLAAISAAFAKHRQTVTFDNEMRRDASGRLEQAAKWDTIKISNERAAKIAAAVAAEKLENGNELGAEDRDNKITRNADGTYTVKEGDMAEFAYRMGAIQDLVNNATHKLTSSDAYREAHANAKGADNK
jgi:hypothetical protein